MNGSNKNVGLYALILEISQTKSICSQYSIQGNLLPPRPAWHSCLNTALRRLIQRPWYVSSSLPWQCQDHEPSYVTINCINSSVRLICLINFRLDYASYHRGAAFVSNISKNYASILERWSWWWRPHIVSQGHSQRYFSMISNHDCFRRYLRYRFIEFREAGREVDRRAFHLFTNRNARMSGHLSGNSLPSSWWRGGWSYEFRVSVPVDQHTFTLRLLTSEAKT